MPETARAKYTFLPYVRQGLAAALSAAGGATAAGRMALPVRLRLNGGEAPGEVVSVPLSLYGPGDVVGVDPAEVIRSEPAPLTADFDPQYFPVVEFDTPDFPWMFTPEGPDANGRLRPWLTLVVVRDREPNTLSADAARPLATLSCELRELPDLAEAWAWAHAQVAREALDGAAAAAVRTEIERVIAEVPRQNLSRLVCPRRLEPNTAYVACVVPTFEAGRLAGLGEPVTPESLSSLAAAWPAPTAQNGRRLVTLPVYHHWRFSTAAGSESFETLVRRLERRTKLPGVGQAVLDVSAPGWTLPDAPGAKVLLEGALAPAASPASDGEWSKAQREAFEESLRALLNAPAASSEELLVAPPIYGQQHAGRGVVAAQRDGWLQELNLDPRYRVAAGLGALVVRAQQEELMAAAWEQVEAVERANAVRRQAQLAREVGASIHQRLTGLSPETFLQITEPAHGAAAAEPQAGARAAKAAPASVSARVRDSALPETALSASFRRVARRQGPIARRFDVDPAQPVRRLAEEPQAAAPARPADVGLAALSTLAAGLTAAPAPRGAGGDAPIERAILQAVQSAAAPAATKALPRGEDAFRSAAAAQQARLSALTAAAEAKPAPRLGVADLAAELSAALDPALSVPAAVAEIVPAAPARGLKARSLSASSEAAGDPLAAVMAAPNFPAPMYKPLRDLHDMLLPGLEKAPPNSIALLKTNPRFIEAYMVGLNHEFARELLWREYPTDRRGTYFRQFWDVRGGAAADYDLPPIAGWQDGDQLGGHLQGAAADGAEEQLVLLIRGDLLRRYPGAVIYAVKAGKDGGFPSGEAEIRLPRFSGAREPEVSFVGFDLTEAEACGTGRHQAAGGWYFVLQEQPTAPRFGLDPARAPLPPAALGAWRNVSWGHLASTPEALQALAYAPVAGPLAGKSIAEGPARITWGQNAGHMARIALQRAYRIAIHASALLAPPSA